MGKEIRGLLGEYKLLVLLIAVGGVAVDVFFRESISGLLTLLLIIFWLLSVWLHKSEGQVSVGAGLLFLALCPFLLILEAGPVAEKAAIWAYLFLAVGVTQQIITDIRNP